MNTFHWFEAKQLDRVTNFSTEIECIKGFINARHKAYFYCSFAKRKEYYDLPNNIVYLGNFKNKYLKYIEFKLRIILKSIQIVCCSDNNVLMVNQDLVVLMKPALWINRLLVKNNKFVLDIRTLPTSPETFERSMRSYNRQVRSAARSFDGLSFITPFLEKVSLDGLNSKLPTVNWSSGVDIDLFNASKYDYDRDTKAFRLFYHGGISVSRGNLDLIKACEKVVARGYNIELVQIGKIVDNCIRQYIKDNRLESWCKLHDALPLTEMPNLVAHCDLPVLPFPNFLAWRVSSPIKLMEYLAMGKPVLVPDMECFTDILDEKSGMVYYYNRDASDVIIELADAIICRIEKHNFDNNEFIKNQDCIDYVSSNFTWEKQSKNLVNFCVELCQKNK